MLQWLIEHGRELLAGSGVGTAITAGAFGIAKLREQRALAKENRVKAEADAERAEAEADTAISPRLLDRITKLEESDVEKNAKLEACEQQHGECRGEVHSLRKQMGARDRALDLLARELERRTTPRRA